MYLIVAGDPYGQNGNIIIITQTRDAEQKNCFDLFMCKSETSQIWKSNTSLQRFQFIGSKRLIEGARQ